MSRASTLAALLLVLVVVSGSACASGPLMTHFDTDKGKGVQVGMDRAEVERALGHPHHMSKLSEHPKGCVERWKYENDSMGWLAPNMEALVVDIDDHGRVCDTARTTSRMVVGGQTETKALP